MVENSEPLQTRLARFGYGVSYNEIRCNKLTDRQNAPQGKVSSRHMAGQLCLASVALLPMIGRYRAAYCISCIFQHWVRTSDNSMRNCSVEMCHQHENTNQEPSICQGNYHPPLDPTISREKLIPRSLHPNGVLRTQQS